MDWMESRVSCSVEHVYARLKEMVVADVAVWTELNGALTGSIEVSLQQSSLLVTRT